MRTGELGMPYSCSGGPRRFTRYHSHGEAPGVFRGCCFAASTTPFSEAKGAEMEGGADDAGWHGITRL